MGIVEFIILSVVSLAAPPDTTTYSRYENENLAPYRVTIPFEYPVVEGFTINMQVRDELPMAGGDDPIKMDMPAELNEILIRAKEQGANAALEGFRVQLYSGGDLEEANKVRADFLELYPGFNAYRLWIQPTFRVRAGDFPTRNEAMMFMNEIRKDFPGAFVVPDRIERPKVRKPLPPKDPNEDSEDGNSGE